MSLSLVQKMNGEVKNKASSNLVLYQKPLVDDIDPNGHKAKRIINEAHSDLNQMVSEAEINSKNEEELKSTLKAGIERIGNTVSSKIAFVIAKFRKDVSPPAFSDNDIDRYSDELSKTHKDIADVNAQLKSRPINISNWIYLFWGIYVAVTLSMSWISTARLEDFGFRNIDNVNRVFLWLVFGLLSVGFGFAFWYLVVRNFTHKFSKNGIRIAYLYLIPIATISLVFFISTLSLQIIDAHYDELIRLKKIEKAQIENNLSVDEETPVSIIRLEREIKSMGYTQLRLRLFGTLFLYLFEIGALICFCNLLKIISERDPETQDLIIERDNLKKLEDELSEKLQTEICKKKFAEAVDDQCSKFEKVVMESFHDRADSIAKTVIMKWS